MSALFGTIEGVTDSELVLPDDYDRVLADLKSAVARSRRQAARVVNTELLRLYWTIGDTILTQQKQASWGSRIIDRLAKDLTDANPGMRGLSRSNLEYMRRFAAAYPRWPIPQHAVGELPWGHVTVLLDKLRDPALRDWYASRAVREGWTRKILTLQIASNLSEREGVAPGNLLTTLDRENELAHQLTQDPVVLDFLNIGGRITERQLEDALMHRIERFMLSLGRGFAFCGRQVRVTVARDEYFIDMLFFHIPSARYVVVELKIEKFKPEHLGQLDFYVTAVDETLRNKSTHAATVGILLCPDKNDVVVEYAVRGKKNPLAVSRYTFKELPEAERAALPSADSLRDALNTPAPDEPQQLRFSDQDPEWDTGSSSSAP